MDKVSHLSCFHSCIKATPFKANETQLISHANDSQLISPHANETFNYINKSLMSPNYIREKNSCLPIISKKKTNVSQLISHSC